MNMRNMPRDAPMPPIAPVEQSTLGFLLLGLFLFLPGVLIAWAVGRDGHGWESGGRAVAWVGACLSPFVWLAILVIFTLILTGSVTLIGCLLPGANCLA